MGQSGERADEYTGLVADHLEWAGQVEQACTYLRQAGEQAAARFANAEALDYLGRALALVAESNLHERYTLLLVREAVWSLQGEREAQDRDLQSLQALAAALDDDRRRAEVALRRASYAEAGGDYAVAGDLARKAVALGQSSGEPALETRGYLGWGRALSRLGDNEASRLRFEEGLALARMAHLPGLEADSLRFLGIVAYLRGDYGQARASLEEALRVKRELGDRLSEGALLNTLGAVANEQGDRARAVACFEEALALRREAGDRMGEAEVLNNLGAMADEQGDYPAARSCYETALGIKREIGDRQGESATLNNLGSIADTLGDYAQARAYWEQALEIKQEVGDRRGEEIVLINLGLLAHHLGDNEAAQEFCRQVLEIAQDMGDRRMRGHALVYLGHALAGLGRTDEAVTAYREALAVWQELGQQHMALDALAGLARGVLVQEDLSLAQDLVDEILDSLERDTLPSSDEPFRVYLTCYRVLSANQDPRSDALLRTAHALLHKRAEQIGDEALRRMFLERVVVHREIEELFAHLKSNSGGGFYDRVYR
jgi:tetratricopeptide (TPR) repeat protein